MRTVNALQWFIALFLIFLLALLSLIYNIGAGNLKKSELLKKINSNPDDLQIKSTWQIFFFYF